MSIFPQFGHHLPLRAGLIIGSVLCIAGIVLDSRVHEAESAILKSETGAQPSQQAPVECFGEPVSDLNYSDSGWLLTTVVRVKSLEAVKLGNLGVEWSVPGDSPLIERKTSIISKTLNIYFDLDPSYLVAKDEGDSVKDRSFWETTWYSKTLRPILQGNREVVSRVSLVVRCNCECSNTVEPGVPWRPDGVAESVQSVLQCISANPLVGNANDSDSIPLDASDLVTGGDWLIIRGNPGDSRLFDQSLSQPEIQVLTKGIAERYSESGLSTKDRVTVILLGRHHSLSTSMLRAQQDLVGKAAVDLAPSQYTRVYLLPMRGDATEQLMTRIRQELLAATHYQITIRIPRLFSTAQLRTGVDLQLTYPGCNKLSIAIPVNITSNVSAKPSPLLLTLLGFLLTGVGLATSLVFYRYNVLNLRKNLDEIFDFPWDPDEP